MKNAASKATLTLLTLFSCQLAWAQGGGSAGYGTWFIYGLIGIAVLVFFFIIVQVADNLMVIEAKQSGVAATGANFSLFPRLSELFSAESSKSSPDGQPVIVLKRGHDILLKGEPEKVVEESVKATTFAIQPPNFIGISPIPKLLVEEGQDVKAGDHLFFDKKYPEVKWVAPVSGEVIAIKRGAKRAITEVVILADKEIKYRELESFGLENSSREELVNYLLDAGAWPLIRQRPYNIIANPAEAPRDIFISTFDTAPLAADQNLAVEGQEAHFQKGLDVLNKLTDGTVYLGLDARKGREPHLAFAEAKGVEKRYFRGKHPAGNVGVQIHHIKPINMGDIVWTLGVQEVITLGRLIHEQRFNSERIIALAGAELKSAKYVRTHIGANVGQLLEGNLANTHVRYISGDVLSGAKKDEENFLNFYDGQITVVEEGDDFLLFGWLLPSLNTPSISPTLPAGLLPNMKTRAETNTHGERRAFVVTGNYEAVTPMDIYPQELMKAILIGDFELIEGLGIYEVVEEDLALCEFVCVSKQPVQEILRKGLDMMREQS